MAASAALGAILVAAAAIARARVASSCVPATRRWRGSGDMPGPARRTDPPNTPAVGTIARFLRIIGLSMVGAQAGIAQDGAPLWTTVTPVPGTNVEWRASLVQPDGRVLLVGDAPRFTDDCAFRDIILFSVTPDGATDPTFGSIFAPGVSRLSGFCGEQLYASAVALDGQGRILVAGVRVDLVRRAPIVFRLSSNGGADASFGPGGAAIWVRPAAEVQHDDVGALTVERTAPHRVFVAGHRVEANQQRVIAFALGAGGAPEPWGDAIESDGRRYHVASFTRSFQTCAPFVDGIALEPGDGLRVLVRVNCRPMSAPTAVGSTPTLLRLRRSSNQPAARHPFRFTDEPAFDAEGYLPQTHALTRLAFAADGDGTRSWVVGIDLVSGPAQPARRVGIAALDAEGRLDPRVLAGIGRATLQPAPSFFAGSIAEQTDGRLIIAGQSASIIGGPAAFRFSGATAAADPTFGTDGTGLLVYPGPGTPTAIAQSLHRVPGTPDYVLSGPSSVLPPNSTRRPFATRIRADVAFVHADGFEPR